MRNVHLVRHAAFTLVAILLAADTQAAGQCVSGKKLLLKPGKLVLLSKDPSLSIAGADPTSAPDSVIWFRHQSTVAAMALPASNWSQNGTGTLFKYKNAAAPAGPSAVKVAKLKNGLLKVVAKGLPFAVPNGAATIEVELALGSNTYSMRFSGTGDGTKFMVKDAPASCCGNDIKDASEQCDGADSAACPGECLDSCICPVCGNNIREGDEACDGSDNAGCLGAGACESDCGCPEGLTCVGGGSYPTCGGACPAGQACMPFSQGDLLGPQQGCICGDIASACPPGQASNLFGGCASIPTCLDLYFGHTGYPACSGGTVPGQVCQPASLPMGDGLCLPVGSTGVCAGNTFGPCPGGQDCVQAVPNGCRDRSFPWCATEGTSCGSCGSGLCSVDNGTFLDYSGPGSMCVNVLACSAAECFTDADCPMGQGCAVLAGLAYCCGPCM